MWALTSRTLFLKNKKHEKIKDVPLPSSLTFLFPGEEGEQGPRHPERPLPEQRHHPPHAHQRGLRPPAEEGELIHKSADFKADFQTSKIRYANSG